MKRKTTMEWIGTGSGLNPSLGNTSFTLTGSSRTLLVDCGSTVPLELIKQKRIDKITDIAITHQHADHIGGLEGFACMHYYALNNRLEQRPNLHLPSEQMAHDLWEYSLRGGLYHSQDENGIPVPMQLSEYFNIHICKVINIPSIPQASFFQTEHVPVMENYGLQFSNGVHYSGDTVELPPHSPKIIFQDCQFSEGKSDVHISYQKLNRELPSSVKEKMYLVHLGSGSEKFDPKYDGFAGFVQPGQKFEFLELAI